MIDKYKNLLSKTIEIEESLKSIETIKESTQNLSTSFNKSFLNYSIIGTKRISIASFDIKKDLTITLQCQIDLSLLSKQNISFSLIINDFCVFLTRKQLESGHNQIVLTKNYTSYNNEKLNIYLEINTLDNKVATLESENLLVIGLNVNNNENEYNAIESNDGFLLSCLVNNNLYIKNTDKNLKTLNLEEFNYLASAKSHCIVYLKNQNKTYIFRVDLNGKLFYCNTDDMNEKYITDKVNKVYTSTDDNIILVSFIKNNSCYYFDIENGNVSKISKLEFVNNPLISCYNYYNKFNDKFYLIVTDRYNSNFIVESIIPKNSTGENLKVDYKIDISTYEVNDENESS